MSNVAVNGSTEPWAMAETVDSLRQDVNELRLRMDNMVIHLAELQKKTSPKDIARVPTAGYDVPYHHPHHPDYSLKEGEVFGGAE